MKRVGDRAGLYYIPSIHGLLRTSCLRKCRSFQSPAALKGFGLVAVPCGRRERSARMKFYTSFPKGTKIYSR